MFEKNYVISKGNRGPEEKKLVDGVRLQLIELKTRPLLRQLEEGGLSDDKVTELRTQTSTIQ